MVDNISLDGVEAYKTFFQEQAKYEQIHVHLQCMRKKEKTNPYYITKLVKGASERVFGSYSYFGDYSYHVVVETLGADPGSNADTGSEPFFNVGTYTFGSVVKDEPTWDQKGMVVGKKGKIKSLKISVFEGKNLKFSQSIPRSKLGPDDADWLQLSAEDSANNLELSFRVRIASKPNVSKSEFDSIYKDKNLTYEEVELKDDETGEQADSALLQCFRHKSGSKKAILWILGRNDGFMHSHVFYGLLNEPKFDLYVLNYRSSARCLQKGWVEDPHFNSHCRTGNHNEYINEISKALKTIQTTKTYDKTLGYAHSTGAPIFFNYLIEIGDTGFDGFVFNSPFLDFGGKTKELMGDVFSTMAKYKVVSMDFKIEEQLGMMKIPTEVIGKCKYKTNDQELFLSDWAAKLYSMYYFNTGTRPVHIVPITAGYMRGVEELQDKVRAKLANKDPITMKPFIMVASRSDDTLDSEGMRVLIDAIGTARTEIELRDNAHDVFLSNDKRDNDLAMDVIKAWMQRYGFY